MKIAGFHCPDCDQGITVIAEKRIDVEGIATVKCCPVCGSMAPRTKRYGPTDLVEKPKFKLLSEQQLHSSGLRDYEQREWSREEQREQVAPSSVDARCDAPTSDRRIVPRSQDIF